MAITQTQVNDYLTEMGIDAWYPRVHLANAPAPLQLVETAPNVQTTALHEPVSAPAQPPVSAPASVNRPVEPERSIAPASAATDEAPPATSKEPAVRFGLGLYVIGEWVVASSLSGNYQVHQEAAFQLMQAILNTLGQPSVPVSHDHIISWPFFANPNARQGRDAARDYVAGMIEHLVETHTPKKLLVFGGVLPKLNQWREADGEDFGMPRLVLPSLYKMLQEPEQKARAWSLIQQSPVYARR